MRHLLLIVAAVTLSFPVGAGAVQCTVTSMEGKVLEVDEPAPGAWQESADAVHAVFKKAKVYGMLFEGVFGGSFKVQEIKGEMEAADKEWDELMVLAQDHAMRYEGTCAGDILAEMLRKADRYREPERNSVLGVLGGKPVQASAKQIHEGREEDYLQFERRYLRIVEEARVGAPAAAPPAEEPPAEEAATE